MGVPFLEVQGVVWGGTRGVRSNLFLRVGGEVEYLFHFNTRPVRVFVALVETAIIAWVSRKPLPALAGCAVAARQYLVCAAAGYTVVLVSCTFAPLPCAMVPSVLQSVAFAHPCVPQHGLRCCKAQAIHS